MNTTQTQPRSRTDLMRTDLMRIDRRFGTVLREGPWLVPATIEVALAAAEARLDFTQAVATDGVDTVHLRVDIGLGADLTLVVPPGVKVIADGLDTRFGDLEVRTRPDTETPVRLTVVVSGRLHGGGDLVVRAPRRNFDQWLRPGSAS